MTLSSVLVLTLLAAGKGAPVPSAETQVAAVIDGWHDAAAKADEARYFAAFTPDAVFLGTDASERWEVAAFRAFAKPYFARGRAWTFLPRDRHVSLSEDGKTAWFDEALDSAHYGVCRGTGVLRKIDGAWKIAQYNLTIPIPNPLADQVVDLIRKQGNGAPDGGR